MRKLMWIPILATAATMAASCGPSTSLKTSWKDPSITQPMEFKKVLSLMIDKDGAIRRTVEDYMVQRMTANYPGIVAVPGYTILAGDDLYNKDAARQIIEGAGFDGVVACRVIGVDQQTTYVPGSYPQPYYNFYGYYDYAWPMAYDPGYIQTDTIVNLETLVYSVKDGKLVWTGVTETFNPSSVDDLLAGVATTVSGSMRKDGVIR